MSICRIEIPSWGAPRSTEYGAQIRVTVENGAVVLEANDAGLTELALEALSLAGPGVPAGTWVEIDEYGGVLAEGSMPVILSRTDSSAGEERAPWSLLLDSASAGSGVGGLGVDIGQGELAIYGDGAALAGLGRWLLLAGPCSGLPAAPPPREAPPVGAPDALSLRRVASTLDAGQYPAVWEVGSRRPVGCRVRLDYEVDDGGRRWLSARALRELDGLLSGCSLAIDAPGGAAELVSVPTIDCLVPSRGTGAPSEGGTRPARDSLLLPGAGGRPVRHRRGAGRLPVRGEPPRGPRDARASPGLRVQGPVDVGGRALPAPAVARGRAEAGALVPRALPDKDGGGRRRGKEIAVVEIVPYVRFGSVIFGEKSYELDVNMDLPAGFLVRCDAVGAVDAVVTNSTEGLVLDGYGPLGLSFAEASRAFGGAGSIVRPRGLCDFRDGLTFELKSGQAEQARDYIFTVCARGSIRLLRWRMYDLAMKMADGEAKCRELDEWVDHNEWGIALETLVSMAEESPARLSAADYGLVRRIGRRMGMDGEFFAWLSQVEGR